MIDISKAGSFQLGSRTVTRMGYGAMQLAGPGVFGPPKDRKAAVAVLREAVAAGVNHIDTSDFYGPHVTNQIIREALHPYPDDLVIVTKVGALRGDDASWMPAQTPGRADAAPCTTISAILASMCWMSSTCASSARHAWARPRDRSRSGSTRWPNCSGKGLIRHLGLSNVTAAQVAEAQRIAPWSACRTSTISRTEAMTRSSMTLARTAIAYVPFFPLGGFTPLQSKALSDIAARVGATPIAGGAGMAAGARAQHPADPGHVERRAPQGKSGSGRTGAVGRCGVGAQRYWGAGSAEESVPLGIRRAGSGPGCRAAQGDQREEEARHGIPACEGQAENSAAMPCRRRAARPCRSGRGCRRCCCRRRHRRRRNRSGRPTSPIRRRHDGRRDRGCRSSAGAPAASSRRVSQAGQFSTDDSSATAISGTPT